MADWGYRGKGGNFRCADLERDGYEHNLMTAKPIDDNASVDRSSPGAETTGSRGGKKPEWADGLKQLYDSVVEEDLPDSFKDLLSKLDNDIKK